MRERGKCLKNRYIETLDAVHNLMNALSNNAGNPKIGDAIAKFHLSSGADLSSGLNADGVTLYYALTNLHRLMYRNGRYYTRWTDDEKEDIFGAVNENNIYS